MASQYLSERIRPETGHERDLGMLPDAREPTRSRKPCIVRWNVRRFVLVMGIASLVVLSLEISTRIPSSSVTRCDEEYTTYQTSLTITIVPEEAWPYVVLCPVPVNATGVYNVTMLETIKVTGGTSAISLVESRHGPALRIAGEGKATISWMAIWRAGEGPALSMPSMLEGNHSWFSSDMDMADFDYRQSFTALRHFPSHGGVGGTSWSWGYAGILEACGWQTVRMGQGSAIIN